MSNETIEVLAEEVYCRVMWPTYLYVDKGHLSDCHNSWGGYGHTPCKELEVKNEDTWNIFRCVYCHDDQIKAISCLGAISSGRRCKSENVDNSGYCSRHQLTPRERFRDELVSYDPSRLFDWNDAYERAAIAHAKRTILRDVALRLSTLQIGLTDLLSHVENANTYVYFIQCKNYVKIGKANNPESRLKSLKAPNDVTLKPKDITHEDMKGARIIATLKGKSYLEGFFHSHLRNKRVEGEWFVLDSHVAKVIEMTQDPEFTLQSILTLAIEEPSVIPEVTSWARQDNSIYTVLEETEQDYEYYKEMLKNPPPPPSIEKVDLMTRPKRSKKQIVMD